MIATIRFASAADLDAVLALLVEHAQFERAGPPAADIGALRRFLFDADPRAWCAVADVEGRPAGYATWSREFSTWDAAEFVHLDCLYVQERFRSRGLGAQLMRFVADAAAAMGCRVIEWQTPAWNVHAIRFYDRSGATGSPKMRYRWRRPEA